MQKTKKIKFLDYRLASLKENKEWTIVYYVRCPIEDKLKRRVVRVPKNPSKVERRRQAKAIVSDINDRLSKGWNEYLDFESSKQFNSFSEVCNDFLEKIKRKVDEGINRYDTLRSYRSQIKNFIEFSKIKYIHQFNKSIIQNFIDYIYFEKKRTSRTANNYLSFLNNLSIYFLERGYTKINPTLGIKKIYDKRDKIRKVIDNITRTKIKEYLENNNKPYYLLCMLTYFCFIRRKELTYIKVKDISLYNCTITLQGTWTKNHKTQVVSIHKNLLPLLAEHLKNASENDYLFSTNDYTTGVNKLEPKKISDEWAKMRKKLKIPKEYQFYSLKDTGITNLLKSGVPLILVRDQARHHDISVTNIYTSFDNAISNPELINSKVSF